MPIKIADGAKLHAFTAIDLIEALSYGAPQPLELGPLFLLATFDQPQAFAHHLTGVAIAAGTHKCPPAHTGS